MNIVEEWDKKNPKIGLDASRNPAYRKKVNTRRALYGNYRFRNALMEVLTLVDDPFTLVSIDGYNRNYFYALQKNLRSIITRMIKLL